MLRSAQLRQRRLALADEQRAMMGKPEGEGGLLSDAQAARFDALKADIGRLDAEEARALTTEANDRAAPAREVPGITAGIEMRAFTGDPVEVRDFRGEVWRDSNGAAIPVLGKGDTFAAFVPEAERRGAAAELGLAGFLRVAAFGARTDLERRVLAGGAIATGGAIVPTPLAAGVIDMLRARTVSIQAGARMVPMTAATLRMARQTSDPVGGWRAENAAILESDPVFDNVAFSAKSWAVRFNVSRELLEDGQNTDAAVRSILAGAAAVGLDQGVLVGSGTGNQPLGIRGQTGIQAVSMGTNGAQLTNWTPVLNAVQALETANAGTMGALIMHPRTARALYGLLDTTNQPLLPPKRLENVPILHTTSMPINETQGSALNASSIITGDFNECLIGLRTDLTISVLNERFAEIGQVGFVAWMRADVQLARPAALARIAGIIP